MKDVAERANISQSSLSYIESGSNTPTIETLANILSVYGMTLSDFFHSNNHDATPLSPELKELINHAKHLSPDQIKAFAEAFKTLK